MEDLHEGVYCHNCEKVFSSKYAKDKHDRSPGTCEREIKRKSNRKNNNEIRKKIKYLEEEPLSPSSSCTSSFKSTSCVPQMYSVVSSSLLPLTSSITSSPIVNYHDHNYCKPPEFSCHDCETKFSDRYTLDRHKNRICPLKFSSDCSKTTLRKESDVEMLAIFKKLSPHDIHIMCQKQNIYIPGVYPLIFPHRGYNFPVLEKIGCVGNEAYNRLTRACEDGPILLPNVFNVLLESGSLITVGPPITIPKARVDHPYLNVTEEPAGHIVTMRVNNRRRYRVLPPPPIFEVN